MDTPRDYDGPRWQDWLFAFCCTLLIGYEVFVSRGMAELQTAYSYYAEVPGVRLLQGLGLAVTSLVVGLSVVWIFVGRSRMFVRLFAGLAVVGFLVCWAELVRAAGTQPNQVFLLNDLPLRPVNNMGIVGAQVFATYLLVKAPDSRMSAPKSLAVKAGLAVCLWLVQWLVWDGVSRGGA